MTRSSTDTGCSCSRVYPSYLRSMPRPMPRCMIVSPLEQAVLRVASGRDVGDEVEDLLAGQLVQQALGHDRARGLGAIDDLVAFQHHRLRLDQRVLDHLHLLPGLLE